MIIIFYTFNDEINFDVNFKINCEGIAHVYSIKFICNSYFFLKFNLIINFPFNQIFVKLNMKIVLKRKAHQNKKLGLIRQIFIL